MRDTESTDSDEDDLAALFASAIATLADGMLMFPFPFDLASAAALAVNDDTGDLAEQLFSVTAQRDTAYRVAIYATAPGVGDREVLSTRVPSTSMLVALLDTLIEERIEQAHDDEGKLRWLSK